MNIPEYEFEKMPSITKTNYRCIYYDSSENKYLVKMKFKNNCINDYFLTLREAILFHDAYKKNILDFSKYDKRLINHVKRKPNLVKNLKKKKRKRKRNTRNTKNTKNKRYRIKLSIGDYQMLSFNQNNKCNICLNTLGEQTDIDHILSINKYNDNNIKNHQILCRPCHKWKSGYVDRDYCFNDFIVNQKKKSKSKDELYTNVIYKLREMHSDVNSKCSCKLKYFKNLDNKIKKESSCLYYTNIIKNIFKF